MAISYTPQTYSFLELFFHRWKWVRKRSKGLWVRYLSDPAYEWVKFDLDEARDFNFIKYHCPEYAVENWTGRELKLIKST